MDKSVSQINIFSVVSVMPIIIHVINEDMEKTAAVK
jgi:hypothetical protein